MTARTIAPPPARADSVLPPVDQKNLRRAAWAGGIGTALENFDLTIFGTASAIIFSKIFFSSLSPASGMLASFGVLFIGFFARPVGGMFFSKYGDRLGRKFVMVATLFLMGTATFAIGLLPTYAVAGIWSPILLLMVRFLQGFGAGAEQASGIVLLTETAPKGKRGRYSSLVFVGAAAGAAMGAIVWILVQMMPKEALMSYGWRLVFFSSIFVTIAAWVIRRRVSESPVFQELKVEGIVKSEVSPIGDVWKHGKKHLARIFFMNIGANAHSYIFQVFIGGYLDHLAACRLQADPEVPAGRRTVCLRLRRRVRDPVRQVRTQADVPDRHRLPGAVRVPCLHADEHGQPRPDLPGHRGRLHDRLAGHRRGPGRVLPGALRLALPLRRRGPRTRVLLRVRRWSCTVHLRRVDHLGRRFMVAGRHLHGPDHGHHVLRDPLRARDRRPRSAPGRRCEVAALNSSRAGSKARFDPARCSSPPPQRHRACTD